MTKMLDDKTISKIASEAANKTITFTSLSQSEQTPLQPRIKDCEVSYEHKAIVNKPSAHSPYYYERFYSLSDKAKNALNEAYLMRKEPFTDKRWIKLMVDFTEGTNKAHYTGSAKDLRNLKTMAVYYVERYRKGLNSWRGNLQLQNTIKAELNSYRDEFARPLL